MELIFGLVAGVIVARLVERYTRDPKTKAAVVARRIVVSAAGGPGPFRPGK
jgi:hypothetical protein